jgi:RNA polymerase sigma-70 factor, ECF subfamily
MLTRTWTVHVGDVPGMRVRVTPTRSESGSGGNNDGPVQGAGAEVDWETADEQALVDAALSGLTRAFDVIVERHRRQVYQLCYRFVGNHEDASDLAQDVFIRAYRGLRGFRSRASLGTWLYRIAVNVSLNRMALKAPRTEALEQREHRDMAGELPDAALLRAERAAEVRAAIAQLPRKQRATLILRVYHELPHKEIAGILGSSVGGVKANFFHALANLKKLLR